MIPPRLRALLTLVALAALPLSGIAATGGSRPAAKPAAPKQAVPSGISMRVPLKAPAMADTVLATVYGSRNITLSGFRKGCRKLGVDPARLTPLERRQVLEVLIDQNLLAARVAKEPRDWTARDSADYAALRDKVMLNSALNMVLYQLATPYMERGDTVPDMRTLGIMARDSAMKGLNPRFDDWSLRHLAAAFAALPKVGPDLNAMQKLEAAGKLPEIAPTDSGRTLAECDAETLTVADAVREFARLSPLYRPRIEDEQGVIDLVGNIVFNNLLRKNAEAQHLDQLKGNAAQLAERAEFLDIQRFVQKNVYSRIVLDSAAIKRHWTRHPERFHTDAKAEIVRMVFDSREEAARWGADLAQPGRAESLATQSARAGVPYAATLAEQADSALFKRVRKGGKGVVLGPDSTQQGWRVLKVMDLTLDRRLAFDEGYDKVKQNLYEDEGERLMRVIVDELRMHTIVFVNEKSSLLATARRRSR